MHESPFVPSHMVKFSCSLAILWKKKKKLLKRGQEINLRIQKTCLGWLVFTYFAPSQSLPDSSDWAYSQLITNCESPQRSYKILKENELNSISGKVSKDFLVKML